MIPFKAFPGYFSLHHDDCSFQQDALIAHKFPKGISFSTEISHVPISSNGMHLFFSTNQSRLPPHRSDLIAFHILIVENRFHRLRHSTKRLTILKSNQCFASWLGKETPVHLTKIINQKPLSENHFSANFL